MFGIRTRIQFDSKMLVFCLSSDNTSMKYKRNGAKRKKFHLDMSHIFCKCYFMLYKQIISHFVSSPSEPRTRSGHIRLSLYTFSHIQLVLLTAAPSWVPPPTSHPWVPAWGYGPWKWLGKFYIYKFNAVSPNNLSSARLKITKGAVFQANFS